MLRSWGMNFKSKIGNKGKNKSRPNDTTVLYALTRFHCLRWWHYLARRLSFLIGIVDNARHNLFNRLSNRASIVRRTYAANSASSPYPSMFLGIYSPKSSLTTLWIWGIGIYSVRELTFVPAVAFCIKKEVSWCRQNKIWVKSRRISFKMNCNEDVLLFEEVWGPLKLLDRFLSALDKYPSTLLTMQLRVS